MAFWNKKKEDGKKEEEEEREEKPSKRSYGATAKLEELEAKIKFLNEEGKVNEEKFSRLHEQIGEIRASSIETEKSIQNLVLKAERAVSLVSEVQPEKLLAQLKKVQAKVEVAEERIELGRKVSDNIVDQIKSMNKAVSAFKGVAQVAKESQRLQEKIGEMKKLEKQMELHADQIEKRYLKFQKRYLDFKRNKRIIREARKLQYDLQKEVQKHDRMITGFATKEDLVDLEDDLRSRIEFISGYREEKSVLGAFKKWTKKGSGEDPAPMPILFSMNPKKKHYITFKWDGQKKRWYLDIEEMVEEQAEEEPVVTEEGGEKKSTKREASKKKGKKK